MTGTIVWPVYFDTLQPNPALTAHPVARTYEIPSATAPGGKQLGHPARRCRVCRSISTWAISKARRCASAPRRARRSPR